MDYSNCIVYHSPSFPASVTQRRSYSIVDVLHDQELRDIVKGAGKPLVDYAVVDVRDADYDVM